MNWQYRLSLFMIMSVALACGGAEAPPAEAVEPTEPEPATVEQATTPEMVGGGKTTEVHPGNAGSPHVMTEWMINEAHISITYGRPYLKGRTIGESVEPMAGKVWRIGADEATTLKSDKDLMIGGSHIPAGEYTLFLLASDDEAWQLIVNNQTGQWGTEYDEEQDLTRVNLDLSESNTPSVEQVTFSIGDDTLKIEWGTTSASVPLALHM